MTDKLDNAQSYLQEINVLHKASVGVILTRTKEPFRVIGVLRDFAAVAGDKGSPLPFEAWTITNGWTTYKANSNEVDKSDGKKDPFEALQALRQKGIAQKGADEGAGIFAMMSPHYHLTQDGKVKHPPMVQLLKEYAQEFAAKKKRLIIITPYDFQLPHELEDDVVMVDFETPDFSERQMLFQRLMEQCPAPKRPKFTNDDANQILNVLAGMTSHEVTSALARALAANRAKLPNVTVTDFLTVLNTIKTEAVKRTEVLELQQPEDMNNVGGLDNLKEWVGERANCFTEEARAFGIDAPKGIALIGPPGTGKSLAAKAISSTLRLPMVRFDISRVFNSLVGSTEARIRTTLKMVDSIAPVVLFIDEVDKVFDVRSGGGDSGVSQRVLGSLLTWMNDSKAPVFTVVTANRVEGLPAEFLRKGRMDEVFCVGLPTAKERLEVLRIHLKKRGKNPDEIKGLEEAVNLSEGYVPAELEAAVKEALVKAFSKKVELNGALIAEQLSNMKPLSETFGAQFAAMQEWAKNNARPASKVEEGADKLNLGVTHGGGKQAMDLE